MSNTAYIGSGTTLSSKYYLRSFYRSNREAGTSSKRREFSGNQLALADGRALRQAVRRLTSSDFSDDQDANTRNSVLAYIQTYNNMLSSAGSSSDRTLERSAKQLKNITSEYSSELDKIGITVNDDGTLTSRTTLFESADLSKFKELFSADAAYMQRTSTYAKRFASRGEALVTSDTGRRLYVTLGQFSIIRLERDTQLLIPAYDYCVPEKECAGGRCHDDPCEIFAQIRFPVEEFFPANECSTSN